MHNKKLTVGNIVGFLILVFWAVLMLYPLLWVAIGSLKNNTEIYNNSMGLPGVLRIDNYVRAWNEANIKGFFLNSVLVTAVSVFSGVFLSLITSYIIARFESLWTKTLVSILTASMMLPVVLTLVPKFLILRNVQLLDTHLGLILIYIAAGIPFGVFLMRSFYQHLPWEFEESAYLDGATPFQTFLKIIVPVSKPGMMVIAIFLFLQSWNEIFHAMVMLTSPEKYTIPIGMVRLIEVQQYSLEWGLIFAGVIMAVVPIIIFFIAAQKQIMGGLTAGAVKG